MSAAAAACDARLSCAAGLPAGLSEGVLRHKYNQPDDGAASEVDDVVDRDHLQV